MNAGILFAFLFGLNLGFIFMNLPPVVDELKTLYAVGYTGVSILISAMLWTHALLQIPAGMITDRIGVRPTLLISTVSLIIGNLVIALTPDLAFAISGRVLAGIGSGLAFVAIMKLLTVVVHARRAGSYQSYFAGIFSLGSVISYLAVPRMMQFGWRTIHLAPAAICLILLALLWKSPVAESGRGASPVLPFRKLMVLPSCWLLGAYHALSYGTVLTLGNWVPSLLTEIWKSRTLKELAWAGALIMFISGVGRMCGGLVLLRYPARAILNGSLILVAALLALLCLVRLPEVVLFLAFCAAFFASLNFGSLFYLASQAAGRNSVASVFGLVNFLANVGAVLFTLMFGLLKDQTGSFRWGFGVLTLMAASALLIGSRLLVEQPSREQEQY